MTFGQKPVPIIVVGSANQDYIVRVATPPAPGETVLAESLLKQPGGKGANQAVAAARLGGNVSFIGCVSDDADGAALLTALRSEGVDTSNVEITNRAPTGLALVAVYDSGENSITVVPGSNFALNAERVQASVDRLAHETEGAVVVVQAELLTEVIESSIHAAAKAHGRAILNLAPYRPLPERTLALCDPLVVNEAEASAMVGWAVHDDESARRAAEELRQLARSIVITLGAEGAVWADPQCTGRVQIPFVADVVDTTGAGDSFVGALAVVLAQGASLEQAVRLGVRAGTYAVGSPGAQSSYPTLSDLGVDGAAETAGRPGPSAPAARHAQC